MRLLPTALTVGVLFLPGPTLAQEKSYPPEVRAVLAEARKDCSDAGGKRVEFERKAVRKVDLTGDGRDDFIIDLTYTRCVEREATFCGSGGCDFAIVVAKRSRGYTRVFSQRVNAYRIEGSSGARTIRFHLHGGFCGKSGSEGCVKRHRNSEKPFEFKQQ